MLVNSETLKTDERVPQHHQLEFDLRHHTRVPVNKGALAFYKKIALGQIIDINLNGIAFSYYYSKTSPLSGSFLPLNGTLDIFNEKNDFSLCNLPVVVAYNCEQDFLHHLDYPVYKWRCGLKFEKVINGQMFQLKHYLSTCMVP